MIYKNIYLNLSRSMIYNKVVIPVSQKSKHAPILRSRQGGGSGAR